MAKVLLRGHKSQCLLVSFYIRTQGNGSEWNECTVVSKHKQTRLSNVQTFDSGDQMEYSCGYSEQLVS